MIQFNPFQRLLIACATSLVCAAPSSVLLAQESVAEPQAPAELTPEQQALLSRVQRMRAMMNLQAIDLAAIGTNQATAETVLDDVEAWVNQNGDRLAQVEQSKFSAQQDLKQAYQSLHASGNAQEAKRLIETRRQALDNVEAERLQMIESLRVLVSMRLVGETGTKWNEIRENRDLPRRFRYVGALSAQQREVLLDRAKTMRVRNADQSPPDRHLDIAPGLSEKQLADRHEAAEQRIAQNLEAVQLAEERALGLPPDRRGEDELSSETPSPSR